MASGFSQSEMRVGHAEREEVAAELREHYASGRLTLEELNERLEAALAAKTRGDLAALMTDLPSARPFTGAGAGGNASGQGPGAGPAAGQDAGAGWGTGRRAEAVAMMTWTAFALCAMLALGFLGVFGLGVGRPFGIALILAGLTFLRRLFFRRQRVRGCGPRRRW